MKSMEALKCDFCGGGLIIDDSREFAVCEFCGTKYMASTLRAKIQEIRGTVKVEGAIETTVGNAEKERLLENAETYLRIFEYSKAYQTYLSVANQYPNDYRGWWGTFVVLIEQYFETGIFEINQIDVKAVLNAFNLADNKSVFKTYFDKIADRYGSSLRIIKNIRGDFINPNLKIVNANTLGDIDTFSFWLIYGTTLLFDTFTNKLQKMILELTESFARKLKSGELYPSIVYTCPPLYNSKWNIDITHYKGFCYMISRVLGCKFSTWQPNPDISSQTKKVLGRNQVFINEGIALIGKWFFYKSDYGRPTERILLPKEISIEDIRKFAGVCIHCGAPFKGAFSKTCSKCGKAKDY